MPNCACLSGTLICHCLVIGVPPPDLLGIATMAPMPLSPEEIRRLRQSARFFAWGVVRTLKLPTEDLYDLRQEIAYQVLRRLPFFDEQRSPFGAFVDLVARHAAGRLWRKASHRQCWEGRSHPHVDPAGFSWDADDEETVNDPGFESADLRHDLKAVFENAPAQIIGTFLVMVADGDDHPASRTTWYRRRVELRRWLLAHGLAPPP